MIDGITILNQYEDYIGIGIIELLLGIIFIVIGIGIIVFEFSYGKLHISYYIVGFIFLCMGTYCVCDMDENISKIYRYDVIIDDAVSIKELYEKYEIINIKGKIYTIEEKEI